ncbi:hypothetical protein ZOSMA_34G01000 [Zostera marina]|uniref:DUF668 domain-containing protein n=1 Tax=Zostera marina TaxID=29655 RepID=A0A0K9P9F7_ZOSMR|nr:hypothetical protein ZOSMA_34G01000 [Zostera marina]
MGNYSTRITKREDSNENQSVSSPGRTYPNPATTRSHVNQFSPDTENSGIDAGEPQLSKARSYKSKSNPSSSSSSNKVAEVSSKLGKAGMVGVGKAVEVLDTLSSSMTNLNISPGFVSGVTTKGNKISILAFEVANTIVKGFNLMESVSEENVKYLKELVLPSEGVQLLISKDMDQLLRIASSDKREELKIFTGEVVRFGNLCKDPQWHNLDRYFEKLGYTPDPHRKLKEDINATMQPLITSVQYTAELYHELNTLDRFDQDYRRKVEEERSNSVQKGDNHLQILKQELKCQKKHVKSLKKKSLWFKILEEVMEDLVDIVLFLHFQIHEAFGTAGINGNKKVKGLGIPNQRLGYFGLALHYANIITQIDTLVSRSSSVPSNIRDTLYQGLPPNVKSSFRTKLHSFEINQELTVSQIKSEMERILKWLVPIASNTTKAHHGFGWVGEWANTGYEFNRKPTGHVDLMTRIETLHHASKEKTEAHILHLVVWLHHLISISQSCHGGIRSPIIKSPILSPIEITTPTPSDKDKDKDKQTALASMPSNKPTIPASTILTKEDQDMLLDMTFKKSTLGISKSQEFTSVMRLAKQNELSKCRSSHHFQDGNFKNSPPLSRTPSIAQVINFDINKIKALDVIDRVDSLKNL